MIEIEDLEVLGPERSVMTVVDSESERMRCKNGRKQTNFEPDIERHVQEILALLAHYPERRGYII